MGAADAASRVLALVAALALPVAAALAHDCKCRSDGKSFAQGEVACVAGKLMRCGMFLNNSSWTVVADACPLSLGDPPPDRAPAELALKTPAIIAPR